MQKYFCFKNRTKLPQEIEDLYTYLSVSYRINIYGATGDGLLIKRPTTNSWHRMPVLRTTDSFEILFKYTTIVKPYPEYSNTGHGVYAFFSPSNVQYYHLATGTGSSTSNNFTFEKILPSASGLIKVSVPVIDQEQLNLNHRWMSLKYNKSTNTFYGKTWISGEVEPDNPQITFANEKSLIVADADVHGLLLMGYNNWLNLEYVSYGTGSDSASREPLITKTFYGSLKTNSGEPIANRMICLYAKYDGALMGTTTSDENGNFTFSDIHPYYEDEQFYVAASDDVAETAVITFKADLFI